jgi:DNA-binding GntR family transcriptional regulator
VYPQAERHEPLHVQIANYYKQLIRDNAEGFRPGDPFPSNRAIAAATKVSYQTAAHAVELLTSAKLLHTVPRQGRVVAQPRVAAGPEDQYPPDARIEVRAAGLVPANGPYAYVRPILGLPLEPDLALVIRREWVAVDSTGPYMLTVNWVRPEFAEVPELLAPAPLPGMARPSQLIEARMPEMHLTWGTAGCEARQVLDDGREAPLLGLSLTDHVLAYVYGRGSDDVPVEYTEFIVREHRVIETQLAP